MNEAAHAFAWVTDKEATATEAGLQHEECAVCSYAKAAVEIPATGTATDPTKPNTSNSTDEPANTAKSDNADKPADAADGKTPQTGDSSTAVLWLAAVLAAGAALTGTLLYGRRKHNQ